MSNKRKAIHKAHAINKKIPGARSTGVARQRNMNQFIEFCSANQIDLQNPSVVTQGLLSNFTRYLATDTPERKGNSVATIHNKLAAVRAFFKGQGIDLEGKNLTLNSVIGIGPRSRVGKKLPATDEIFNAAVGCALSKGEVGFAHCIRLERYLGHRGLEAVMSPAALLKFATEAQELKATTPAIYVVDGTKGGRPRET